MTCATGRHWRAHWRCASLAHTDEEEVDEMGKLFALLIVALAAGAAIASMPDIKRYLEMRRM